MVQPIKLLLVDDHHIMLAGLKTLLKSASGIDVIGEASSGEEGIRLAEEKEPDVILMDIKMEGMNGLEATREILEHHPKMRILILTACNDDVFPIRLLREGACGYITKDCSAEEVVKAIRVVYAGERYIMPQIAQRLALCRFSINEETPFDSLSERELQVVLMITSDAKKAMQIAKDLSLSPKTVNTYRYRIFEKLGVNNDVKLVHLAWRYGIIAIPRENSGTNKKLAGEPQASSEE